MATRKAWTLLGSFIVNVRWYERTELDGAAPGDFERGFTSRTHYTEEIVEVRVQWAALEETMRTKAIASDRGVATFQGGRVAYNVQRAYLHVDAASIANRLAVQVVTCSSNGSALRCCGLLRVRHAGSVDEVKTTAVRDACAAGMKRWRDYKAQPI